MKHSEAKCEKGKHACVLILSPLFLNMSQPKSLLLFSYLHCFTCLTASSENFHYARANNYILGNDKMTITASFFMIEKYTEGSIFSLSMVKIYLTF